MSEVTITGDGHERRLAQPQRPEPVDKEPAEPEARSWPSADMWLEFAGTAEVEVGGGTLGPDWEADVIVLECFGVRLQLEVTEDDHLRKLATLCLELVERRQELRERRRTAWEDGWGIGHPPKVQLPALKLCTEDAA
ncbi:MAG: hypothetical protein KF724_06085 [Phycisphaeraceae bacterium]|nr:hypothetical protein [Phycisphaeraceae bacterium]